MTNFTSLPPEIRLCIFHHVFPQDVVQSLQFLGFRNGQIDMPPPNVFITVSASTLQELYLSNPAGTSLGRFVKPSSLFAVSRQIRRESLEAWGNIQVQVGVSGLTATSSSTALIRARRGSPSSPGALLNYSPASAMSNLNTGFVAILPSPIRFTSLLRAACPP